MKNLLVFLFLLLSFSSSYAGVQDSVGVEKKGDKYFIKHKMEAKETLFALSRKYNVPVNEIKEANPGLDINDISIGQVIYVPAKNYKEPASKASAGTHMVQPKETLYGLSKQYKVSVKDIEKANPELSEKGLQVGMVLIIPTTSSGGTIYTPAVVKPKPAPKPKLPATLPSSNEKVEKIKESGVAEPSYASGEGIELFAFHRTAPVGTIIQVINEATDQQVFVRVVGGLQNVSSETVLIQLSPKAIEKLKGSDKKFKVKLYYFAE